MSTSMCRPINIFTLIKWSQSMFNWFFFPVNNNNFHHHQYSCHMCANLFSGFNTFFSFRSLSFIAHFRGKKNMLNLNIYISHLFRLSSVWSDVLPKKHNSKLECKWTHRAQYECLKKNKMAIHLTVNMVCVHWAQFYRVLNAYAYKLITRSLHVYFFLYPFLNVSHRPPLHTFARQWNITDVYCVDYVSVFVYVGAVGVAFHFHILCVVHLVFAF